MNNLRNYQESKSNQINELQNKNKKLKERSTEIEKKIGEMDIRFEEMTRKQDSCEKAILSWTEVKLIVKDYMGKYRKTNWSPKNETRRGTSAYTTADKEEIDTECTKTWIKKTSNKSAGRGQSRISHHRKRSEGSQKISSSNGYLNESSSETKKPIRTNWIERWKFIKAIRKY